VGVPLAEGRISAGEAPPEKAHRLATAGVGFYFAGVGLTLLLAVLITVFIQGLSTLLPLPLSTLLGFLVFFLLLYPWSSGRRRPSAGPSGSSSERIETAGGREGRRKLKSLNKGKGRRFGIHEGL
jgi:hypothetical protein